MPLWNRHGPAVLFVHRVRANQRVHLEHVITDKKCVMIIQTESLI
jgi:hypothetical protein